MRRQTLDTFFGPYVRYRVRRDSADARRAGESIHADELLVFLRITPLGFSRDYGSGFSEVVFVEKTFTVKTDDGSDGVPIDPLVRAPATFFERDASPVDRSACEAAFAQRLAREKIQSDAAHTQWQADEAARQAPRLARRRAKHGLPSEPKE
jgi:hypothetical protein